MEKWSVALTEKQKEQADSLGYKRRTNSRQEGRIEKINRGEDYSADFIGARGELAFSLMSGLKWNERLGLTSKTPDVGIDVQVVTRRKFWHDLIIRLDAPNKHRFVLVISEDGVVFKAVGWITGEEAKKDDDLLKNYGGYRRAYFIPKSVLHQMETFKLGT